MNTILIFKLLLAHLLGDFWLQPESWVAKKDERMFAAWQLYVHAFVVAALSWMAVRDRGFFWFALILFVSHFVIDGLKSWVMKGFEDCCKTAFWVFAIDQVLHLAVCIGISSVCMLHKTECVSLGWLLACGFAFCGTPANVLIKFVMRALGIQPRGGAENADSLEHAGACIGTLERWLVLAFALCGHYEAAGLIVAAKSLLRFTDKQGPRAEYVLVGTLFSLAVATLCAFLLLAFAFRRDVFEDKPAFKVNVNCIHGCLPANK